MLEEDFIRRGSPQNQSSRIHPSPWSRANRIRLASASGAIIWTRLGTKFALNYSKIRFLCGSGPPCGLRVTSYIHLTQSVYEVVLQKSISAQIRQLILYISNNK